MSTETIEVAKREQTGSIASNKLRQTGHVPAILYGHGEENVNLSVSSDAIGKVIQHGTKVLSLTGAVSETALLKDVQWDAFGIDVLHIDLTRVSQSETVEVALPVELHGEAPGLGEGGQLSFPLHQLTIKCPASNIPDHLTANISSLHAGESVHASEIELPEGAELVTPGTEVVVLISGDSKGSSKGDDEESQEQTEPEVIGKGKEDSEAEGE